MIKKVYRDSVGNVINIGEWDYKIELDEHEDEIINNPLPEGATSQDEEIELRDDGGLAVKS